MRKKDRKCITKIRLYRFQSYVDETITFDPASNAIVGNTDAGKTALTRALYWTLYNRPTRLGVNNDFLMYNETHCFVSVYLSDGTVITRGRNKEENYYTLQKGKETKTFKGFGFEVPPEIMDAHGMHKLSFDDSDNLSLNVSQQLEPIFLFDDTASKRAKMLGKLSGADRFDGGIGIISGWQKNAVTISKTYKARMGEIKTQLAAYPNIDELETKRKLLDTSVSNIQRLSSSTEEIKQVLHDFIALTANKDSLYTILSTEPSLQRVEEIRGSLNSLQIQRESLLTAVTEYTSLRADKDIADALLRYEEAIVQITTKIELLRRLWSNVKAINTALGEYHSTETEVKRLTALLQGSQYDDLESILAQLTTHVSALSELQVLFSAYMECVEGYARLYDEVLSLEESLQQAETAYKDSLGDQCPVCGQSINTEERDCCGSNNRTVN